MSQKIKRIYFVGPAYPYRGGIAAFNERLAQTYQEMGYEVKIHTFSLQYPEFLFPGKTQYSEASPPKDLDITRSVSSINPFNWWSIGRKIAQEKPDLVITRFWLPFMGPCLGTIGRRIKKNKHTKFLSIVDNIIPHEHRIGDKTLAQYFVNTCDGFMVMSKSVLEDMKQFTQTTNIDYIPHPIYDNYGERVSKTEARKWLNLGMEEKVLLFFGLVRKYKGLDLLLEAMADERIRKMGVKAIVAGEYYDDPAYYQEIIQRLGIQDQIISKPEFVPDEDVKYYFCGADMVVQPYKTATQSGISQIAYHFERPMLVTAVGGLPEIVIQRLPQQDTAYRTLKKYTEHPLSLV
ncbi:MAG: glycosyltransferase, partial [Chitinophagales bacterium]